MAHNHERGNALVKTWRSQEKYKTKKTLIKLIVRSRLYRNKFNTHASDI